jgi:hypothetical protein
MRPINDGMSVCVCVKAEKTCLPIPRRGESWICKSGAVTDNNKLFAGFVLKVRCLKVLS